MRSPGTLVLFKDRSASTLSSTSNDDNGRTGKVKNTGKDKDKGAGSQGEKLSLKLSLIVSIEVIQKTGKDNSTHLIIELADETVELKFKASVRHTGTDSATGSGGGGDMRTGLQEAERWKTLLLLWKDYSIDYGKSDRLINGLIDCSSNLPLVMIQYLVIPYQSFCHIFFLFLLLNVPSLQLLCTLICPPN